MRTPSFMMLDVHGFLAAIEGMPLEAVGGAVVSMVKAFVRGKPFADDQAEARAVQVRPCRLKRLKAQFGELFECTTDLATTAREHFDCPAGSRRKFPSRSKNAAKSPTKSTIGAQTISLCPDGQRERGGAGAADTAPRPAASLSAPDAALAWGSRGAGATEPTATQPEPSMAKKISPVSDWLPPDEDIDYALERTDQDDDWLGHELTHFRETRRIQKPLWPEAQLRREWRRWIARGLAWRCCKAATRAARSQHRKRAAA